MINFMKKKIIKINHIYKIKQGVFSLIKKLLFKWDPLSLETVKVLNTVAVKLSFSVHTTLNKLNVISFL